MRVLSSLALLLILVLGQACGGSGSSLKTPGTPPDAAAADAAPRAVTSPDALPPNDAAVSQVDAPAFSADAGNDVAPLPDASFPLDVRDGSAGDGFAPDVSRPDVAPDVSPALTFPVVGSRGWRITLKMTYGPDAFVGRGYFPPETDLTLDLLPTSREVALGRQGSGGRFPVVVADTRSITLREARLAMPYLPSAAICRGLQGLSLSELSVAFQGRAATGTARGRAQAAEGDFVVELPFTATITGEPDSGGPQLRWLDVAGAVASPFVEAVLASDRLLPSGTKVELAPAGAAPTLLMQADRPAGESAAWTGTVVRGFGRTVELRVLPALVDLTGTPGPPVPPLPAITGPGLLAQDGFEGGRLEAIGGTLVSEGQAPIPSGKRALVVDAAEGGSTAPYVPFIARLAVPAGATRFVAKLRFLRPSTSGSLRIRLGHVATGGVVWGTRPAPREPVTTTTLMMGGGRPPEQVQVSALDTLEVTLPAGARDEVILMIDSPETYCLPSGNPPGLLLDDLRVE